MRRGRPSRKASGVAKFRTLLIGFLAALLFWQSGLAAAHCLRSLAHGGDAIEICSIDGVKVIHLDDQGNPLPEQPTGGMGGFCPACHGVPAAVTLPEPPVLALPAWTGETVTWHAAGEVRLLPPARAPPYRTRAPPILTA